MPEVSGGATGLNQAAESLPCEIVFPEGLEAGLRAGGRMIDGDDDRRRFPRLACRTTAAMRCTQAIPAIRRVETWVRIVLRNVSRCGAGLWHSEQLFPEEECLLLFPNGVQRQFKVKRCRRVGAKCYEIGGEFSDDQGAFDPGQIK